MDSIVSSMVAFLDQYLFRELIPFLISLCPVLELRGGIIAAYLLDIPWITAFIICFIGNVLPVPLIILFGRKMLEWMKKSRLFSRLGHHFEKKAEKKSSSKQMQKYKLFGLFLFVAIPIPGTGAWTGSLVAAVLNLRLKHALPITALGVFVAGIIVTLFSYGLLQFIGIG